MAKSFRELFKNARKSAEYWAEVATLDFTGALHKKMQELNVNRTELANRIDASPAYVTKIMNGTTNFTIKSMTALAHAVGQKVRIVLEDEDASDESLSEDITYMQDDPSIYVRNNLILITQHKAFELDAENESNLSLPLKVA
jgi:transcriptional regulator with XRE-family HTH domain